MEKVSVVTVTYGDRWKFLSRVVASVMKDEHVTKLVIVDNASRNKEDLIKAKNEYGDKIAVLHQEKNLGAGTGFNIGISYARDLDCDYVMLLDDDNVPENGTIAKFLEIKKTFGDKKVILLGNRENIPGSQRYFYEPSLNTITRHANYFEVFSFAKFANFIRLLTGIKNKEIKKEKGEFKPIVKVEVFSYGGSFIPVEATREAPLPDTTFVLYGDDGEYSWGLHEAGYVPYLCFSPKIYDVDISFGGDSNITGYFDAKTPAFKAYYHIKNCVRISRTHTTKLKVVLFLNIFFWNLGLCILGFIKYGVNRRTLKRAKLIFTAVYDGYFLSRKAPEEVKLI